MSVVEHVQTNGAHMGAAGVPYVVRCALCETSVGCTQHALGTFFFVEHTCPRSKKRCGNSFMRSPTPSC